MRRFFAPPENFANGIVALDEDETRHLRDVLRLRVGGEIAVFDGQGKEFRCSISEIGKRDARASITSEIPPASPESPLDLTLAAAVLKGEKFDLVVQKAVELGVTRLIPVEADRCDVRLADAGKRIIRWQRICMEATKQCGRARLMQIDDAITSEALFEQAHGGSILFSESGGSSLDAISSTDNKLTAIVGPEGGWDVGELELARSAGISIVTLGGRILRAETAAIGIAAILQHRYGDLN